MEHKPHYPALDDDEGVDAITIKTVPRLKESELSGDEWRVSALVTWMRKGRVLMTRTYGDIKTALAGTLWDFHIKPECFHDDDPGDHHGLWEHGPEFCMQPGCSREPVVFYRMQKRGDGRGNITGQRDLHKWEIPMRCFCAEHKYRGDSDFDDMMTIYQEAPDDQR